MHKSEAEKKDSILDEHQQIYRRHNQINNILAYCACIAWIPCIIAAFGVDGIYLKILFAVLACCGAVCFFIFFFTLLPESLMVLSRQSLLQPAVVGYSVVFLIITAYRRNHAWYSVVRNYSGLCV